MRCLFDARPKTCGRFTRVVCSALRSDAQAVDFGSGGAEDRRRPCTEREGPEEAGPSRRTVCPDTDFSAPGRRIRSNVDFLGYSLRKLRPTFGKQELRDVAVPDRAGSL